MTPGDLDHAEVGLVDDLAVLEEARLARDLVVAPGVPVEPERPLVRGGRARQGGQERRVAVFGEEDVRVGVVEVPVEGVDDLSGISALQGVRRAVVAQLQLQRPLVLRRHVVAGALEHHHGERRDGVLARLARVTQLPAGEGAVLVELVDAASEREEPRLVEEELRGVMSEL